MSHFVRKIKGQTASEGVGKLLRVGEQMLFPFRKMTNPLSLAFDRHFYAPPQKVAGYYVIPSELLSVRLSVRPSAVEHSCPLHNFDTLRDNFTKLGTNINHDQTTGRD